MRISYFCKKLLKMNIHFIPVGVIACLSLLSCKGTGDDITLPANAPVDFSAVTIRDGFWKERIERHASVTAPFCLRQCTELTGRADNFAIAAGVKEGTFKGFFYDDSDLYKSLEGVAYSLSRFPNPNLESKADSLIGLIGAAQQDDGYINTYFTLVEPERKWQVMDMHEAYCAGHLIEAGIAYFHATGKKNLLDIAIRFADHICDTFGEGKRDWVPGHEEIELALVKLYRETGNPKYLEMARFFLEERGKGKGNWKQAHFDLDYHQDLVPVKEMERIGGHAVRATYLMTGMADYCAASGDTTYLPALRRVWDDLIESKTYITGGIGASHGNEGFSDDFYLPNKDAYCETCSSVGFILWDQRMNMLLGDGKYEDALETTLYNAALDGISLSCDRFFYVNPLASDGDHHRQPWYETACCPSQISRFLPSVGGYLYATSPHAFWVHQYAASEVQTTIDGKPIRLEVDTNYPWEGHIGITLHPGKKQRYTLKMRIPAWSGNWSVRVNGRTISASVRNGYISVKRYWNDGDKVDLTLDMSVKMVEADPRVHENKGLRAIRRGPIIYCAEETDNPGSFEQISLSPATQFTCAKAPALPENIVALSASDGAGPHLFIPYFTWDNREAGKMAVWFPWRESSGAI